MQVSLLYLSRSKLYKMMCRNDYFTYWSKAVCHLLSNIEEYEKVSPNTCINTFTTEIEQFYALTKQLDFDCYNVDNDNYLELFAQLDILLHSKTKPQEWKTFFVNDAFLDLQFNHNWVKALIYFLHNRGVLNNLPSAFLLQFSHSYGLILRQVDFMSAELKSDLLLLLSLQSPDNQKKIFCNLFSDKTRKSFITHNIYLGLLDMYYSDLGSEARSNYYRRSLSRIHYKVYPGVLIEREDEVIDLLAYFIKRFRDLDDKVLSMLTLNFDLGNLATSSTKDLYMPLREAIQLVGGNIEEARKKQSLKIDFLTSVLPKVIEQNVVDETIELFFEHAHFKDNILEPKLIYEISYQIGESSMISYAFWEKLYDYYSSILLTSALSEDKEPKYIHSIKHLCKLLTSPFFSAYMLNYGEIEKKEKPELTDYMTDGAVIIAEENWDSWLRHRIFFENLEIVKKTPMRTIFHSILLGLLESLVKKNGYTYNMERDGRYTIAYKEESVVVIFSYDECIENGHEEDKKYKEITHTETATIPVGFYGNVLKGVVGIYLSKYFNIASVKKQFTDWIEQIK